MQGPESFKMVTIEMINQLLSTYGNISDEILIH